MTNNMWRNYLYILKHTCTFGSHNIALWPYKKYTCIIKFVLKIIIYICDPNIKNLHHIQICFNVDGLSTTGINSGANWGPWPWARKFLNKSLCLTTLLLLPPPPPPRCCYYYHYFYLVVAMWLHEPTKQISSYVLDDHVMWLAMACSMRMEVEGLPIVFGDCELGNKNNIGPLMGCGWVEENKKSWPNSSLIFFYLPSPARSSMQWIKKLLQQAEAEEEGI